MRARAAPRFAEGRLLLVERDEPVLGDLECAVRILRAHVRHSVEEDGGAVTVLELLFARRTRDNRRLLQWHGHTSKVERPCYT
jgi:hypothetical protein